MFDLLVLINIKMNLTQLTSYIFESMFWLPLI